MTQKELISSLCESNPDAVIVSSLGTISYDLKEIDHPNKILVKGAMGHAVSVGLGYSLSSDKKVVVLVGDGSFLMKMGTMATVAAYHKDNLEIHIFNNGRFKSCGDQSTNFNHVDDLFSSNSKYPYARTHQVS